MQTQHRRPIAAPATALTTAANTTPELDTRKLSGGSVGIPAGSSITTLTFYGAVQPGGTYYALYDDTGTALVRTVAAGNGYPFPEACFAWGAIRIVANHAGNVDIALKG